MRLKPELSIIIPTLNEEESLQGLLLSLALQVEVELEVIIADGGSADLTCTVAVESGMVITVLKGRKGRALQLNSGAAVAHGTNLLFLHADSEFSDRRALRKSLDFLRLSSMQDSGRSAAGHFAINFRVSVESSQSGYSYLERKAGLNRKGCSHGDQGILIPAELFSKYDRFDESCQMLAETRFADSLRDNGEWLLLPAVITTSARRFECEGLKERQILNAVIMALGACGREELLDLPGLYLPPQQGSKLQLQPFFREIEKGLSALETGVRVDFWRKTGEYVCENAWQIPFWIDVLLDYRGTSSRQEGSNRLLEFYDRHLQRIVNSRITARLAACASRVWLWCMARL